MSLIFSDSCNIHGSSLAVRYSITGTIQIGGGRFEGQSYRVIGQMERRNEFANDQLMVVAHNFLVETTGWVNHIRILDGTTEQVRIVLTCGVLAGKIEVFRGPSSVSLGSVNIEIFPGAWYYLESEVFVDNSTGYVNIYLDDVLVLALSGIDTQNTAAAQANGFGISNGPSADFAAINVDEIYVLNGQGAVNNARVGPRRVQSWDLSGDGAASDWTPFSGANYTNVDERGSLNTADYVESDTPGDIDLYTQTARGLAELGVMGVQLVNVASESGLTPRQIRGVLRPVATNHVGATHDLFSGALAYLSVFENNPETASPWTMAEIDATEIGQELVT